jgi:outer membrane protein OmpA-like peptidoglycan-associated protein/tetratricopeptide (TPR) repeat protein
MQKTFFFILLFCGAGAFGGFYAQNYLTNEQLDRRATKRLETAQQAVNRRDYAQATRELDALLARLPQAVEARLFRAGVAYEAGRYAAAESDYEAVYALAPDLQPTTLYRLARTEMKLQQYGEAVAHFEAYLAQPALDARSVARAEEYLATARVAQQLYERPVPFSPKSLGDSINTVGGKEYLPSFSADGQYLIYTVRYDGQEDFYYSQRLPDGSWAKGQALSSVNTPRNEGAQSISADARTLFFTGCDRNSSIERSCDLYWVQQDNGRWQEVQHPGEPLNTRHWESQPSLSANGKYLLFVSNRPGGFGGDDLYLSVRQADGQWGAPVNMGPTINTAGNEGAPFLHADTRTLYFMSDGHPGLGGYDLFLTRVDSGAWTAPRNLGYPINTTADEGAIAVSLDGRTAYYTTDKNSQPGQPLDLDIYAFDLYPAIRPSPVTYVEVEVTDAVKKRPLAYVAASLLAEGSGQEWQFETDRQGKLLAVLPGGTDYQLQLETPGYLFYSERFELSDSVNVDQPFVLRVSLEPASPPAAFLDRQPIVLKNVRFATGSADLLPSSNNELDRLERLLLENPALEIRINGHTDNVGQAADNQQLSEQRAKAVYDYLVAAGVDADRLAYEGFGERQPIADNDTPEGRSQNRRTEFEVIE